MRGRMIVKPTGEPLNENPSAVTKAEKVASAATEKKGATSYEENTPHHSRDHVCVRGGRLPSWSNEAPALAPPHGSAAKPGPGSIEGQCLRRLDERRSPRDHGVEPIHRCSHPRSAAAIEVVADGAHHRCCTRSARQSSSLRRASRSFARYEHRSRERDGRA